MFLVEENALYVRFNHFHYSCPIFVSKYKQKERKNMKLLAYEIYVHWDKEGIPLFFQCP